MYNIVYLVSISSKIIMRVSKINQSNRTGNIEFTSNEEIDLIDESFALLIDKQEKSVKIEKDDPLEVEQLHRFKLSKHKAVDVSKEKKKIYQDVKDKIKKDKEDKNKKNIALGIQPHEDRGDDSSFIHITEEGSEITDQNLFDVANAVNEHIALLEKDNSYKNENEQKYKKLVKILDQVQQSKRLFERETPKPTKFGKLRK